MDNIFASKFGLSDVTRVHDTTYRCIDGNPLSESSKELTSFYDSVNPVDKNHPQRLNDIDVLNSVKDPDLKNAMLVALTKQSDGTEIDTSGMTDEEIAATALPQHVTYGQLYDAMQDVAELQSLKQEAPPVSSPVSSSVAEPSPTQTE